jgi:hypothetical protein
LAQLGKALQSGDLAAAQKAFGQMGASKAGGGHGGHHHKVSADTSAVAPATTSTTSMTGNNVNVFV